MAHHHKSGNKDSRSRLWLHGISSSLPMIPQLPSASSSTNMTVWAPAVSTCLKSFLLHKNVVGSQFQGKERGGFGREKREVTVMQR